MTDVVVRAQGDDQPFEWESPKRDDEPGAENQGARWAVYDSARCRNCGHRRDWHYRGRSSCHGVAEVGCISDCREFLSPVLEDMELCVCGHRQDVHGPGCWVNNDNSSAEPDCDCIGFVRAD